MNCFLKWLKLLAEKSTKPPPAALEERIHQLEQHFYEEAGKYREKLSEEAASYRAHLEERCGRAQFDEQVVQYRTFLQNLDDQYRKRSALVLAFGTGGLILVYVTVLVQVNAAKSETKADFDRQVASAQSLARERMEATVSKEAVELFGNDKLKSELFERMRRTFTTNSQVTVTSFLGNVRALLLADMQSPSISRAYSREPMEIDDFLYLIELIQQRYIDPLRANELKENQQAALSLAANGLVDIAQSNDEAAENWFLRAVAESPDMPELRLLLVQLYLDRENYKGNNQWDNFDGYRDKAKTQLEIIQTESRRMSPDPFVVWIALLKDLNGDQAGAISLIETSFPECQNKPAAGHRSRPNALLYQYLSQFYWNRYHATGDTATREKAVTLSYYHLLCDNYSLRAKNLLVWRMTHTRDPAGGLQERLYTGPIKLGQDQTFSANHVIDQLDAEPSRVRSSRILNTLAEARYWEYMRRGRKDPELKKQALDLASRTIDVGYTLGVHETTLKFLKERYQLISSDTLPVDTGN